MFLLPTVSRLVLFAVRGHQVELAVAHHASSLRSVGAAALGRRARGCRFRPLALAVQELVVKPLISGNEEHAVLPAPAAPTSARGCGSDGRPGFLAFTICWPILSFSCWPLLFEAL